MTTYIVVNILLNVNDSGETCSSLFLDKSLQNHEFTISFIFPKTYILLSAGPVLNAWGPISVMILFSSLLRMAKYQTIVLKCNQYSSHSSIVSKGISSGMAVRPRLRQSTTPKNKSLQKCYFILMYGYRGNICIFQDILRQFCILYLFLQRNLTINGLGNSFQSLCLTRTWYLVW